MITTPRAVERRWIGTLSRAWPYFRAEAHEVVADRGLLVVDTVLATLVPLVIQIVLWAAVYRHAGQLPDYTYAQLLIYFVYAIAIGR